MDKSNSAMNEEQLACIKDGLAELENAGRVYELHWAPIIMGLGTASDWFMEINNTDVPKGKGYCKSMGDWLRGDGKGYTKEGDPVNGLNEVERKFALDCWRNREEIKEWRADLDGPQRRKWNSPGTVWEHFKKWQTAKSKGPGVATETSASKLSDKDRIADLQGKLKAIEETSCGDIVLNKRSTAKDNAKVLTATFTEEKLLAMVKVILIDLDVPPEIDRALRDEARAIARRERGDK